MEVIFQVASTLTSNINLKKHSWRTNGWAQLSIFLVKFTIMSWLGMTITSFFVCLKQAPCRTALTGFQHLFGAFFLIHHITSLSLQVLIVSVTTRSWDAVVVWVIWIGNHEWGLFVIRNGRSCEQDMRSEPWVMKLTGFGCEKCGSTRSTLCIQNLEASVFLWQNCFCYGKTFHQSGISM